MKLRIQLLHFGDDVKERLEHDGWKLEAITLDSLSACHPDVRDEPNARRRLQELGLLTSATVRIEFPEGSLGEPRSELEQMRGPHGRFAGRPVYRAR